MTGGFIVEQLDDTAETLIQIFLFYTGATSLGTCSFCQIGTYTTEIGSSGHSAIALRAKYVLNGAGKLWETNLK